MHSLRRHLNLNCQTAGLDMMEPLSSVPCSHMPRGPQGHSLFIEVEGTLETDKPHSLLDPEDIQVQRSEAYGHVTPRTFQFLNLLLWDFQDSLINNSLWSYFCLFRANKTKRENSYGLTPPNPSLPLEHLAGLFGE